MEKEYVVSLKGLTCENCGEKIRSATEKLEPVKKADMNVMAQKMTVTSSRDINEIIDDISGIVKTYEPEVKVSLNAESDGEDDGGDLKKDIIKLIIGAAVFIAGYIVGGKIGLWLYVISYVILGAEVVLNGVKSIFKGHAMDENFLMSLATVGAFAINEPAEAVFVMLFYGVGEYFQSLAVVRSRKSIKSLMELCPDKAFVERDGEVTALKPEDVTVGDIIVVRPGERVPLDGRIISGESELDCSALTGEATPVYVEAGDEVLSGSINNTGVIRAEVIRIYGESTVSKILEMVENAAERKTPAENFITVFSKIYTPIVVGLAVVIALAVPLITGTAFSPWIHKALLFLVVSCPCALVLSVPLAYFAGIGEASKKGILIKGSGAIKSLTEVDTVAMDKTGTLTEGAFSVEKIITAEGVGEDILKNAAAVAEAQSNHPVAKAVSKYCGKPAENDFAVTEISGRGVRAEKDGRMILAGNARLLDENGIAAPKINEACALIYVAENGKYLGCFAVADTIKADSAEAVKRLKAMGNGVYMLTGDNASAAKAAAEKIGIEFKASLLPQDKTEFIEGLERSGKKTLFVGDGINDAPSLAAAHVGMAMGKKGTDTAIEAADVVLMTDEPKKIAEAIAIARNTERIVKQNIIFAIAVKVAVLVLGTIGLVGMNAAVFADVGVALIAVINSLRKKAER